MEEVINLIIENLTSVAITSLVAIVGYVLTTIGNKIKKYLDDSRIKSYVEDVVKCINQAYATLSNEEKYNQAKKEILEWLETEGLKLAESKLKVLIESAVSKNKKEGV